MNLESDQLRKKWEHLYEIRIKVAHNKSMNVEHFEKATELCNELDETINDALDKIHTITIPEKEKESVSLKTLGTINEPTRYFVNEYLDLNQDIAAKLNSLSDQFSYLKDLENPLSSIVSIPALDIGLPKDLYGDLAKIDSFKNNIISGDNFLTIDNNIDPEIFKSTRDHFNSIIDTDNLDYLTKLNERFKLPGSGIKFNDDGTISTSEEENDI